MRDKYNLNVLPTGFEDDYGKTKISICFSVTVKIDPCESHKIMFTDPRFNNCYSCNSRIPNVILNVTLSTLLGIIKSFVYQFIGGLNVLFIKPLPKCMLPLPCTWYDNLLFPTFKHIQGYLTYIVLHV